MSECLFYGNFTDDLWGYVYFYCNTYQLIRGKLHLSL